MSIPQFISILLSLSLLVFGVFVLARNVSSKINLSFVIFATAVSIWILTSSFGGAVGNAELSEMLVKADYIAGIAIATSFLYFVLVYRNMKLKGIGSLSILYVAIMAIIILIHESIIELDTDSSGNVSINEGSLFVPLYILPLLIAALSALFLLLKSSKSAINTTEGDRTIKISLLVSALLTIPSLLGGVVFKGELAISILQELSYVGVSIFLLGSGLAVVRYRMFDIRSVVVRAIGYLLSFIVVGLIIVGAIMLGATKLIDGVEYGLNDYLIFIACISVALVAFRLVGPFFNKITSSIFYRDAYNTQIELDKLSSLAVSRYEIETLVDDALELLSAALKPSKGKFILLDAHGDYYNDYHLKHTPRLDALKAIDVLSIQKEKVFIVDNFEFENDKNITHSKKEDLYEYLKSHDVAMSVRLSTKDEVVGYMLFGPKLSGNIYSRQDIQFIGIAANELAIAIQNARRFDEIQQFNETLKLEVERATGELRASNEKLQALDIAKDEFITMASHQLRTPLTSVKGYLSMVLEGDTGKINKKQREMLGAAFSSSQRMVYLIGDLLNVSRLQTGKFIIEPSVVDVPDMIKSEIEQLAETAKSKDLKLNFKPPKQFPDLYMDETKTRQVIMNFIDNAIYYTPNGGKIDVELKSSDKSVEFTVTDNGIGVPKSEAHNLFTKFYRAANARKARPDGTGLGLFMAKKVIVDQGGAIIFHSKEGEGSTFGFSFPLTRVRPPKKLDEKQKK